MLRSIAVGGMYGPKPDPGPFQILKASISLVYPRFIGDSALIGLSGFSFVYVAGKTTWGKEKLYPWLARLSVLGCRSSVILLYSVFLFRWYQRFATGELKGISDFLTLAKRHYWRFYLSVEAYFGIFYLMEKWRLNQNLYKAPASHFAQGQERRQLLTRGLDALREIHITVSRGVGCLDRNPCDAPGDSPNFSGGTAVDRATKLMRIQSNLGMQQVAAEWKQHSEVEDRVRFIEREAKRENQDHRPSLEDLLRTLDHEYALRQPETLNMRNLSNLSELNASSKRDIEELAVEDTSYLDGSPLSSPCSMSDVGVPSMNRTLTNLGRLENSSPLTDRPSKAKAKGSRMGLAGKKNSVSLGSVNELVSDWEAAESKKFREDLEMRRLRLLQRAELSSWFFDADFDDIRKGNIAQWIQEYFFAGESFDALGSAERADYIAMVEEVVNWASFPPGRNYMEAGVNPDVRCMRLRMDPLPCVYRPALFYLITSYLVPMVNDLVFNASTPLGMGFEYYRSGSLCYWYYPGLGRGKASRRSPLVFAHGIGIGTLVYYPVVRELKKLAISLKRDLFVVILPHISMQPLVAMPGSRELVACLLDLLSAWKASKAHFIGHSFGSILCSWMVKLHPGTVETLTLLDPVCFLLVKADILKSAVYSEHQAFYNYLTQYLVFRELYMTHSLARNFFWQENALWPEHLTMPTLVGLSGDDSIVPATSVRVVLENEVSRRLACLEVLARPDTFSRADATSPKAPGPPAAAEGSVVFIHRGIQPDYSEPERVMERAAIPLTVDYEETAQHGHVVFNKKYRKRILAMLAQQIERAEKETPTPKFT